MKVNEWPESQDKDPTRGVVKTGTHSGVGSAAAHFSKTARRPKKKSSTPSKRQPKLKLLRRMEQIENLPPIGNGPCSPRLTVFLPPHLIGKTSNQHRTPDRTTTGQAPNKARMLTGRGGFFRLCGFVAPKAQGMVS